MKLYRNRDWLYRKYWEENSTIQQIAKLCGADTHTIRAWMGKFGISRRTKSEVKVGDKNPMRRPEMRERFKGEGNPMYGRKGEKSPFWKGGKKDYWRKISREIWELVHGEKIPKGMLIHHRDEDVTNIDPENLQLRTYSGHFHWHRRIKKLIRTIEKIINPKGVLNGRKNS